MNFEMLSFGDILTEERTRLLREANPCHNPPGSPTGGQFCSGRGDAFSGGRPGSTRGGGGGRPATGDRARVSADWRAAMTQAGLRTDRPGKLPKETYSSGLAAFGTSPEKLKTASLSDLAGIIRRDWSAKGKGVNYAAKPYLDAMRTLDKISDRYYQDSGQSIVAYFLGNAKSWTGPTAKAVKAELNRRLKGR